MSFDGGGLVSSHLADGSSGHDVPGVRSTSALSTSDFQLWQVVENRGAGQTAFYKNGDLDRSLTSSMPQGAVTQTDSIFIGREMGGANNRRASMDLAEVVIYNRVLSETERVSVSKALSDKYNLGFVINIPPTVALTSPTNGLSLPLPATLTLAATAADSDGVVRSVSFYESGALLATATAPPYRVPVKIESPGPVTFTAVAVDNRGGATTSAPVSVTITGAVAPVPLTVNSGLQLWLKADAGVTADANGAVSGWKDQSPNGNNATQDNSAATPPANFQPTRVASALNGLPVVHFDGVADFMTIPNSPTLQPGAGDWTVFFVGKRGVPSRGDFPQIIGSRPWNAGLDLGWAVCFSAASGQVASHYADGTAGHDVPATLSGSPLSTDAFQVWQVEENRSGGFTRFYLSGVTNRTLATSMPKTNITQANDLFLGSEVEGADNRRANLDLAELLIYNRALSDVDRNSVTTYLLRRFAIKQISSQNLAPTVTLDSPKGGGTLTAPAKVTLSATAADADGSVTRVEFFSGQRSLGVVTNSPYTLTVTLTSLGNLSLTAAATDNLGATGVSAPAEIRVIAVGAKLIGQIDYSDSFTTNATRTDGLYNKNAGGAYSVEDTHGNAAATWTPTSNFSFNTPKSSTDPAKLSAAAGNPGAATGFAQSGGGDFSFAYGSRSDYVVQLDAIFPSDRLDISSVPTPGGGIFGTNRLSVFLRRDSVAGKPNAGIGLFNGSKETGVADSNGKLVLTGVDDNNWHGVGVNFDQPNNALKIYVDGVLITTVNLATFAGGLYQNYSNGAVGAGGAGGVFWVDNFQVGAPPTLIKTVDYSDTFTQNATRTDGLFNDNSNGAYNVENSHGNLAAVWAPTRNFSFNTAGSSTDAARLGAAGGNSGAATGFAQSGGGDFSFTYGLRSKYVVQVDAILPTDRLDITSLDTAGGGIFGNNKLSVFFRRDSTAGKPHPAFPDTGLPGIGVFNGSKETAVTDSGGNMILTGVDDDNWHKFAVSFNQVDNAVHIYVDNNLKATVDVTSFAGGIYRNYSNGAVGMGGAGGVFWMDNFQVGEAQSVIPSTPSVLSISRQANSITISWTGAGTLEEAADVTGSWTAVVGATSPLRVTPTSARKFYRVKQ